MSSNRATTKKRKTPNKGTCMNTYYEHLSDMQTIAPCLFSGNRKMPTPDEPTFILLVGSPGVGKTSSAKKIIMSHLYRNYDDFYHVSLDTLLERVEPYRKQTREIVQGKTIDTITNANMCTMFGLSSKTFQSKRKTFKGATNTFNKEDNQTKYKSLLELTKEGLDYGVKQGYNIIYDTTLSKTGDKITEMINLITKISPKSYDFVILYVKANPEQIKKQLTKRHTNMIKSTGPVRIVNPSQVNAFVEAHNTGMAKGLKSIPELVQDSEIKKKILSIQTIVYDNNSKPNNK
jgi:dephospho-CoA kinase